MDENKQKEVRPAPVLAASKRYQKPHLIHHGDVRDVTMGPTPGPGESGNPTIFRP